jgi:hypothetical protein
MNNDRYQLISSCVSDHLRQWSYKPIWIIPIVLKCIYIHVRCQLHWIYEIWNSVPSGTKSIHLVPMHSAIHRMDRRSNTVERFHSVRRRRRSRLIEKWRSQSPAMPPARILELPLIGESENRSDANIDAHVWILKGSDDYNKSQFK